MFAQDDELFRIELRVIHENSRTVHGKYKLESWICYGCLTW
jgi:hypothetical protein